MQFTVPRADFARLLTDVSKVVEARNTIPILSNILLSATAGSLSVRGTDLDIEVTRTIGADVAQPGATTVNAARLQAIVGKLAGTSVEVTLDGETLVIKAGRSKFSLPTLPAEDFPHIAAGEFSHYFDLDINALVAPVKYAVSNESTRIYLNGVFLHQQDETLRAVSADGHRLARNSMALPDGAAGMSGTIIPTKTVDVFGMLKGVVSLSVSSSKIRAEQDGTVITSNLIAGTFPDYTRIIPTSNDKRLTVERAALSAAVNRATTVASENGRAVKLSLAAGSVTISMRTQDGSATEEVEADYNDAPIEIGFNSRYLADTLANCSGDTVAIDLSDSGAPGLFANPANANWQAIILPIRI